MGNDCIFVCQFNSKDKKDKFYQGFFRREVSEETFFGAQREYLKETGRYKILPSFENSTLDTITYLYNKSILSRRNNWKSDLGERVIVKAEFLEDEIYKRAHSKNSYIPKYFNLKVWILSEKTGKDLFKNYFIVRIWYSLDNFEYWNYSADYIALLIRNAINGNLQTARDIEETMQKKNLDIYMEEGWPIFKCDECGEDFLNLNDFYCHLLEENHYDSFLDEFPNDRETLHVKSIIERNLAKKE